MKVLVATGLYPPEIGGPATHVEILERELPTRGIEVQVLPFNTVRKYPKVIRHAVYLLLLLSKARGVSIIYALDPVSVGLPALIAARIMRKKFILRVAGDYAWEQAAGRFGVTLFLDQFVQEIHLQPFMVRILAYAERLVAQHADRIVVPSVYLQGILGAWGIEKKEVTVVYNAFAPIEVRESTKEIRAKLGYTGIVIVSAGRLVPWKGFYTLISIVAELRKEHLDVSCVIVGDGPDRARLVARAEECGVQDAVQFVDRQSKEALAQTISAADMFVLNTAYEGFSHQLLEVMALGVPVVTTTVGGNGELLIHEETGLLVPYDDSSALTAAIQRLMQGGELRERLCKNAKKTAESFTVARMIEGVQNVFMSVTAKT